MTHSTTKSADFKSFSDLPREDIVVAHCEIILKKKVKFESNFVRG